jgi:hypothetical protein
MNEKRRREIILRDSIGEQVGVIDITGMANANAKIPFTLEIVERCDLLNWHQIVKPYPVPPWGSD